MNSSAIRPATAQDAKSVADIYAHYVRSTTATFEYDPPDPAEILTRMQQTWQLRLPYLVAEAGAKVVGFASARQFRPRPAYRFTVEDSIYVDASHLGRGIGHQLLGGLIESCREAGARQMIGIMIGDNPASINLHASHGFTHAGILRSVGYKFEQWLDIVLMQLAL